jgi:hypothetical protein
MSVFFDLAQSGEAFLRYRARARYVLFGCAVLFGILIADRILPIATGFAEGRVLSDSDWYVLIISSIIFLIGVALPVYVAIGIGRIARGLTTDNNGVTFHFPNGFVERFEWRDPRLRLELRDWRDAAARRGVSSAFALSAQRGIRVIAILTDSAFSAILDSARRNGIEPEKHRAGRWSNDPGSTIVYLLKGRPRAI